MTMQFTSQALAAIMDGSLVADEAVATVVIGSFNITRIDLRRVEDDKFEVTLRNKDEFPIVQWDEVVGPRDTLFLDDLDMKIEMKLT